MSDSEKFEIVLKDPRDKVYFPGEVVEGDVILNVQSDTKMKGILLKCRGKGRVTWSTGTRHNDRRYHFGVENYLSAFLPLYGNPVSSAKDITLQAGNHVFPFRFELPTEIPGSFDGGVDCFVRYWLKATIFQSWKKDKYCKREFPVGSELDLNTLSIMLHKVEDSGSKTVCCLCCASQPTCASIRLEKRGFVPGEDILCSGEINEGTGRGCDGSRFKLIMQVTWLASDGETLANQHTVAEIRHFSIEAYGTDVWHREPLPIPPIPPSFFQFCNIINIEYFVVLAVDIRGTPFDLIVKQPVVMGTVPLRPEYDNIPLHPHVQARGSIRGDVIDRTDGERNYKRERHSHERPRSKNEHYKMSDDNWKRGKQDPRSHRGPRNSSPPSLYQGPSSLSQDQRNSSLEHRNSSRRPGYPASMQNKNKICGNYNDERGDQIGSFSFASDASMTREISRGDGSKNPLSDKYLNISATRNSGLVPVYDPISGTFQLTLSERSQWDSCSLDNVTSYEHTSTAGGGDTSPEPYIGTLV